ncbi:response regulator [Rhodopirellula sp. JC740]|uniref:histidine kinase n=1 Tax=Rhodopirellula halodulae TaxID=2894198 RepID=A0ABS8NC16_9BACT|nr:ATP-binding protein [Rhodopirellula sp. JC740]MCC9641069.1 response regulator [Rhodopirellula sp. JC740]
MATVVKSNITDEERLRLAVAVAQFGIIEIDYRVGTAIADETAAKLFGLPANKAVSREDVHRRFHPDDLEEIERCVRGSLAVDGQREFFLEHRVLDEDGNIRWVSVRKRVIFETSGGASVPATGIVVAVDVTDQKETEQSLRNSENRLRLAAEATGFGTYDTCLSSGESNWSDEVGRILGRPVPESPTWNDLIAQAHPDDQERCEELFQSLRSKQHDGRFRLEHRILRPSGETRWLVNSGAVIVESEQCDPPSAILIGTLQDITDQKLFEQSLHDAREVAESASRTRGEFLANMSHEIRTPMAAIIGHADILRDHLKDPDNLQVVETIRRNGNFLLEIINDILDLSRIDAGNLEVETNAVRPDAIVAEVRSLMDVRAAEKKLPLKVAFDGPIPELIYTDAVRMRQILVNLVGNAIKFTEEGEVRLRVRYDDEKKTLCFDVVDTGIGIQPHQIERLFQPFVQADSTSTRSFGGTGLGLAICKRLANALDSRIVAESEPGKGSVFTLVVNVPRKVQLVQPNLSIDLSTRVRRQPIRISAKVLVVDDRRDIRYLAQHFIEKAGGEVLTATNGREAIEFLEANHDDEVDLVVMDMQMPVMDGYEATKELRKRGFEKPIVALTANAMKTDRQDCIAAGCTDYTTKPLDSHKLIQIIGELTESR